MLSRYALLLITLILCLNNLVLGQDSYLIKGKVTSNNPEQPLSISVVLMEIKMKEQPSIKPIQKSTADANGVFNFKIKGSEAGTFYRVSTIVNGQVIGSNPVKFEGESRKIELTLELPKVVKGVENINFVKNVLVFDLWEDFVRVTDIIILENRSGATIDASNRSFKRELPTQAMNINILDPPKGASIEQVGNSVQYKLILPPGRYQLYMIYDLPAGTSSMDMLNPLPPAVEEMEIIVPMDSVTANFDPTYSEVLSRDKNFDNRIFHSQSIIPGKEISSVRIIISGIPLPQKKLFYPATILLILLISGLFWYLKNNLSTNHP
ncbi:MAG: hypothetical protein GY786_19780 [Proteobacteria bacterium]|nr:hypothetical protein [Pseudomonadota bacterium]